MRYLISFIILAVLTTLHAKDSYPELFVKQGTPLFKTLNSFATLSEVDTLNVLVDGYIIEAKRTRELGFKADQSQKKEDIKTYFKSLRELQKRHDKLIGLSTKILYEAIKNNDYKEFEKIVSFGISYYEKKPKLRERILFFYKKNRKISKIPSLEKILRYDRGVTKGYDETEYVFSQNHESKTPVRPEKKITLLSMKGCGYCVKVKALLENTGTSYRELDIKNSEGSRLYRKYNGSGVPITIIGNKIIRGYKPDKILKEIQ